MGKKPLAEKLGELVDDFHKVEPFHIALASKLMESLIDAGLRNGVMMQSRLECAIKSVELRCPDLLASQITDHIRLCFSMVRQWKLDLEMVDGRARSKKSWPFRRKCSAAELVIVENLVSKLTLTTGATSTEVAPVDGASRTNPCTDLAAPGAAPQNTNNWSQLFRAGFEMDVDALMGGLGAGFGATGETDVGTAAYFPEESPGSAAPTTPRVSIPRAWLGSLRVFGDGSGSEETEAHGDDDGIPDPCSRRRKGLILQARKDLAKSGKKTVNKGKGQATAKAGGQGKKVGKGKGKGGGNGQKGDKDKDKGKDKEKLHRALLYKTKDGRIEVTAYTISSNKRVHVATVQQRLYGKFALDHMTKIRDKINDDNITKEAALMFKAELGRGARTFVVY